MKCKNKIINNNEMKRMLKRMANEIIEQNKGCDDLVIIGIHTRGVPLAKRISKLIEQFEHETIECGSLDITLYRDDLSNINHQPIIQDSVLPFDLENKHIVLVDDVLNTGRTARAALNALLDYGRPASVRLLVLVDRGNRELPMQADIIGSTVPTSKHETVEVHLVENDAIDEVLICEK